MLDEDQVSSDGHGAGGGSSEECGQSSALSQVDATISSEHEETMDSLFECSNDEDGQYMDLLLNPERYTGEWNWIGDAFAGAMHV